MQDDIDKLRESYGRMAGAYADAFGEELRHKPLDRALLDLVVAQRPPGSTVADVGCGPGHVTGYLAQRGAGVVGVDISPGMVELARARHPGLDFQEASLLDLRVPDGSWGAIVALYSIIHLPDAALLPALRECSRALVDGGLLLVSFHTGEGVIHRDEMLGQPVTLDFHLLRLEQVSEACRHAGFTVHAHLERPPYTAVEGPTTRGYVLGRKEAV